MDLQSLINSPQEQWQVRPVSKIRTAIKEKDLDGSRLAVQECLRLLSNNGKRPLTASDVESVARFSNQNFNPELKEEFWRNLQAIKRTGLEFDVRAKDYIETQFRLQTPQTAPEIHARQVSQKAMALSHIEEFGSRASRPKEPLWKRILSRFRK